MKEVLQKVIADSGLASRREAEKLIKGGLVKINGEIAVLGDRADAAKDLILVNNKKLPQKAAKVYLKLNKPIGYTCTNRVFPGEHNIFELLPKSERLFSIGRLDKDSRGLVLLTNDGDLTQKLAHPRYQHEKIYEVLIDYRSRQEEKFLEIGAGHRLISNLIKGVDIDEGDGIVKAKRALYLQNNRFVITLSEGKKRQVRRMFAALGYRVKDLRRTAFAGLKLADLKEGSWQKLSEAEISQLKS